MQLAAAKIEAESLRIARSTDGLKTYPAGSQTTIDWVSVELPMKYGPGARHSDMVEMNKAALAGYAQSLRGQPQVRVHLFHYSEQDGLDTDALEAHILSAPEVSVLLLATAASSYLWFDPEHCPRNVELCTILKRFREIRVNFIVCPTTESARNGWQQHLSDLQGVFGDFLPETGRVDLWTDFDPEQDLEQEQIRSLICRMQHLQSLQCQEVHQEPRSEWIWKPVGGFILLLVVGFGVRQP
eukprot:s2865_g13.t1